jgi:hypothetical protein
MTTSRFLPIAALALGLTAAGAMLATAQSTTPDPAAPGASSETSVQPVEFRHGGGPGFGGRDGGGLMRAIFAQVDADGNGAITQAEVDAFRTAQVAAADASGDGNLSLDEFATVYAQIMRPQMVDAFQALDEDGDGAVTAAEMDARFGSVVAEMDRNGDGALSPDDRPKRGDRGGRGNRGGDND